MSEFKESIKKLMIKIVSGILILITAYLGFKTYEGLMNESQARLTGHDAELE